MSSSSAAPQSLSESSLGDLMLGVTRGTARGRHVRVNEQLKIGSASDNELVLVDEGVFAHHCVLFVKDSGVVVRSVRDGPEKVSERPDAPEHWYAADHRIRVGNAELLVYRAFDTSVVAPGKETQFGSALGQSRPMRAVFAVLRQISSTRLRLLFEGQPGTGKRLLARAVHEAGPRRMGPFVVVDCSSDPQLLESELFGCEVDPGEPAASGPLQGALEMAAGGTLVLDQVADLPLDVQSRLLEVCRTRTLQRVGGSAIVPVDTRIVSTARRPLADEVQRGRFHAELYFSLAGAAVSLTPLRDRREDIPLLIDHVLKGLRRRNPGRGAMALPPEVVGVLIAHDWPGNVRELEDAIAQGLCAWGDRSESALEHSDAPPSSSDSGPTFRPDASYRKTRAAFQNDFEQRYVRWLLERHQGNISAAAREARMDRKHLYDLARKHGLRYSSRPP